MTAAINQSSLAETLDSFNDDLFFRKKIPDILRKKAAKWISMRQGLPGSYGGMFAPTKQDFKKGIKLFTGDLFVNTQAGIGHILGEEASRVILLLGVNNNGVGEALRKSNAALYSALERSAIMGNDIGTYCCGKCSAAYWRHLTAGGLDRQEERLSLGMKTLKSIRDGKGKWRKFPFYYTLLALSEIDLPEATEEIKYTLTVCERILKRGGRNEKYDKRRRVLMERVLELA